MRRKIALDGYKRGRVDIYGRQWPPGVSKGTSRGSGWPATKREIIEGRYAFNLCFENTRAVYYCTEKIWDAVSMRCLPIYLGSPTIHETFPTDSFLDYGQFASADALFDYVGRMTPAEYRHRYNLCVDTLNRSAPRASESYRRSLQIILHALQSDE